MDPRVQTVIDLMRNDLEHELPLSELVRVVNLSPSHLQRLFKAELGMTTFRYMKLLRMERARYLLESSFLSVKEIMKTVGINNRSHFVKDFKKLYGRTPTQLRLRLPRQQNDYMQPARAEGALTSP
jgi:transcriptional regulator GlxA family with amidase domain